VRFDQRNTDLAVDGIARDFAGHYAAEGRALGRAEGIIEGREAGERMGRCAMVVRLLTRRFGELPVAPWARVHAATIEELDAIGDRLLIAESLEDALGLRPLRWAGSPAVR
jgi:hypothetical protein